MPHSDSFSATFMVKVPFFFPSSPSPRAGSASTTPSAQVSNSPASTLGSYRPQEGLKRSPSHYLPLLRRRFREPGRSQPPLTSTDPAWQAALTPLHRWKGGLREVKDLPGVTEPAVGHQVRISARL